MAVVFMETDYSSIGVSNEAPPLPNPLLHSEWRRGRRRATLTASLAKNVALWSVR